MANIHAVISLGIGSPASIRQFILFGLTPDDTPDAAIVNAIALAGRYAPVVSAAGRYGPVISL